MNLQDQNHGYVTGNEGGSIAQQQGVKARQIIEERQVQIDNSMRGWNTPTQDTPPLEPVVHQSYPPGDMPAVLKPLSWYFDKCDDLIEAEWPIRIVFALITATWAFFHSGGNPLVVGAAVVGGMILPSLLGLALKALFWITSTAIALGTLYLVVTQFLR